MGVLRRELGEYFGTLRWEESNAPYQARIDAIWREMDAYTVARPACSALVLKALLHAVIAERFEPVLFGHSPFYFEMGLRADCNWGVGRGRNVGAWLRERRQATWVDARARQGLHLFAELGIASPTVFDEDHRSLGYTRLMREGVKGTLGRIAARRQSPMAGAELDFVDAAEQSCRAVLRIADRFASKAREMLATAIDAQARRYLQMIAAVIRTFAQMGGATIQFNCVSVDQLRDAQVRPDQHRDMQVRICGLSAYFVALERDVQDEMIARAQMAV